MTRIIPAFLLFLLASGASMEAATVTFSYTAQPGPQHSFGTGSFTFSDGLTSVSLGDLDSFVFNMGVNNGGTTFAYGLGDLASFNATITAGSVSALSLGTVLVSSPTLGAFPERFAVSGLGSTAAANFTSEARVDFGQVTTAGPAAPPAPTPEPASLALCVSALASAVFYRRRLSARS